MKPLYKPVLLFLPLLALFVAHPFQITIAQQNITSPTPTCDPLVEPPLPPNPTEYELGRNLYWHWCMTCHGDRGQGLTNEFRGIWDSEHQNCWARGCHSGRPGDPGFPIPTVVPALVNERHLARFSSQQELAGFLKATHPPQSPGILKDEEYQAIALFVFTMNGRAPGNTPVTDTPAPTPTPTLISYQESVPSSFPLSVIIILAATATIVFALIRIRAYSQK
jgi:mono/diheme cytochrome c family protein